MPLWECIDSTFLCFQIYILRNSKENLTIQVLLCNQHLKILILFSIDDWRRSKKYKFDARILILTAPKIKGMVPVSKIKSKWRFKATSSQPPASDRARVFCSNPLWRNGAERSLHNVNNHLGLFLCSLKSRQPIRETKHGLIFTASNPPSALTSYIFPYQSRAEPSLWGIVKREGLISQKQ